MRYIIDTCTLIFFLQDNLDGDTTAILSDYYNTIYISSVSVMEFAHLIQHGKVRFKREIKAVDVFKTIEEELGFHIDYVSREHLKTFFPLSTVNGHSDPNDRLIIAQAITEKLELISTDTKFCNYEKFGLKFIQAKHY